MESRTAGQAEEALQVLDAFRPDLILTNVRLPGIGGLELIRRIKGNPDTSDICNRFVDGCGRFRRSGAGSRRRMLRDTLPSRRHGHIGLTG